MNLHTEIFSVPHHTHTHLTPHTTHNTTRNITRRQRDRWNRRHRFCHCTQEAQEGEEQSRWTDCRSPAESSPGAESNALDGGDTAYVHSGAARGVVRVYGSTGTENRWSEHSGEISTDCEPEYHEEDLWIHVPGIASSAGVQVETDGLCQRLSREHGCAHVPEDRRVVQRMEPGVQRCAVGRTDHVCHAGCTTSDGRDGSGSPLACSDGKGMVSEQGTSETGCQDLGTCEPGTGTPARSPGEPDHLRHDSGMRGQTLRREVGSERLGLLARRNKMGERELCRRHLSHQRKKARSGGNDKRHHDRVGGCWTGARRKQNTLVIIPCKTWTDTARWHRADTVGACAVFCGNGVGLEWIIVGSSQEQIESRGSGNEKMVPHLQIEKREWEDKAGFDGNLGVGKRFVGRRSVDTDESDEKCDRQLECTYSKYDTGDQERCRRGDGSVVEKIPSSWARGIEEKRLDTVEHGRETRPQMGGHVARLPTNHWLAEVVRARAVQCWRWAQQRHTDKWTGVHPKRFKIFRWEDQLCRWHSEGCTQNPWENTEWWKDAQDRLSWRRAEK